MRRYEIEYGGVDWDLYRDGELIAWWRGWGQSMAVDFNDKEMEKPFKYLHKKPATEAHGLLILNAIKQQLESGEQP